MAITDACPKMAVTHVADILDISLQGVHKQLKSMNLKPFKIGNKSYITHDMGKELFRLKFEKQKIAFQIVKGGTGKTTALHNISCAASLYGAKVLAIDLDPQGNLTDAFNVDADSFPVLIDIFEDESLIQDAIINVSEGIDIIPSRIENVVLDNKLALSKSPLHNLFSDILYSVEDNYDFIFIDCPPTMGHSVSAASLYADTLLVPLNPDRFSAKGLKILKTEIANLEKMYKRKINHKVFLNKYSSNTILSDKAIQTTISAETATNNALNTAIRQSQEIPNAIDQNFNIFSSLKQSIVREDFDLLTRELLNITIPKGKRSIQGGENIAQEQNHAIN